MHGCGKAWLPVHTAATGHLIEAARKADAARALLKDARDQWDGATKAYNSAIAHRVPVHVPSNLMASSPSLTDMSGAFVIPTEAELTARLPQS